MSVLLVGLAIAACAEVDAGDASRGAEPARSKTDDQSGDSPPVELTSTWATLTVTSVESSEDQPYEVQIAASLTLEAGAVELRPVIDGQPLEPVVIPAGEDAIDAELRAGFAVAKLAAGVHEVAIEARATGAKPKAKANKWAIYSNQRMGINLSTRRDDDDDPKIAVEASVWGIQQATDVELAVFLDDSPLDGDVIFSPEVGAVTGTFAFEVLDKEPHEVHLVARPAAGVGKLDRRLLIVRLPGVLR